MDDLNIPDGYVKLDPGTIKEPGDLILYPAEFRWVETIHPGETVGFLLPVIRQKNSPEFESW